MLISDIATIVQNSVGDRGGIMAKDDLIINWVNEAILDIFRKTEIGREAPSTFTLAAGVNEFDPVGSISKEILRVHFLHNGEFEMEESSIDLIMNLFGVSYLTREEVPRFFVRTYKAGKTAVNVYPIPDKEYTFSYSATFTPAAYTLTSQNTDTLVPSSYNQDIIRFCVMRAHELEKDFRASEKAQEHYEKNMFERADEAHELDDSFRFISPDEYDYL